MQIIYVLKKPTTTQPALLWLGVIPKHDSGWCTIYHLSAPHGSSINDCTDPEQYSLSYCSVDDAIDIVNTLEH